MRRFRALSDEVDTGSSSENAPKQKARASGAIFGIAPLALDFCFRIAFAENRHPLFRAML
jgi:hypothetical protein